MNVLPVPPASDRAVERTPAAQLDAGGIVSLSTRAHLLALLLLAGATVLYLFPPEKYGFYPKCPVWLLFHVYCPACGATRALAALLHGRLSDAFHFNMLVTVLTPFVLGYLATAYISVLRHGKPRWIGIPAPLTFSIVTAMAIFAVVRNCIG